MKPYITKVNNIAFSLDINKLKLYKNKFLCVDVTKNVHKLNTLYYLNLIVSLL